MLLVCLNCPLDAVDVDEILQPKAPASCGDNKEKSDCLDLGSQAGDCAWCKGDYMPPSCLDTMAAKYLPDTVAICKMPKHSNGEDDSQQVWELYVDTGTPSVH
jgi:hypothetical protein